MLRSIRCKACGELFNPHSKKQSYYSFECRYSAPAVYRFIAPDGRSYVGAVHGIRDRARHRIYRSNSRLLTAFEQYRPESFTFEVLERLPYRCSERELRKAEQKHIDRLRSCDPGMGFNIMSAVDGRPDPRGLEQHKAKTGDIEPA
jgi:hypothetical protein